MNNKNKIDPTAKTIAHLEEENRVLKRQLEFYEQIIHSAPVIIYQSNNAKKAILWCNEEMENASGYSMQEIKDMGIEFFQKVMHPDEFHIALDAQEYFYENDEIYAGALRVLPKGENEWRWIIGIAKVFTKNAEGKVEDLICAFIDISNALKLTPNADNLLNEALKHALQMYHKNSQPPLSIRQKEILNLLAEGYQSNEIADKLYLSKFTIDTHRKNLRNKLNAKNTSDLITIAKTIGLI